MVRDGVTPSATQSVLMSAGRSLTLTAAVTLNANEQGTLLHNTFSTIFSTFIIKMMYQYTLYIHIIQEK